MKKLDTPEDILNWLNLSSRNKWKQDQLNKNILTSDGLECIHIHPKKIKMKYWEDIRVNNSLYQEYDYPIKIKDLLSIV